MSHQTFIDKEILSQTSFDAGFAQAHIAIREGVPAELQSVASSLRLIECGLGGLTCACNVQRVDSEIDVYDYVSGIHSAVMDAREKVLL